jgi:hypothetical protein
MRWFLLLALSASGTVAPPPGAWSGWARCELSVEGHGYVDRQTHRWDISGTPVSGNGAIRVQAATWSVDGAGSLDQTQGRQTRTATWKTKASGISAPIAFIVRASDGRLLIKSWHAQQRVHGAVTGTQQVTIDGNAQTPGPISGEAFEWSFPTIIEGATVTNSSGTRSEPVHGSVGLMQPANSTATATCSWNLSRDTQTRAGRG